MSQPPARRLSIGVLTFHRCINYGSYWQARCLVEGLRARGHDAVLLDHASSAVERTERRSALQPLLPRRSARADMRRYAAKVRKFEAAFAQLPLSPRFPLNDPSAMPAYDLVVIGSDEVWNFRHPWYGGQPLFFGRGLNALRVVSYAASFGNHDAAAGMDPAWAGQLARLDAISVRDANSHRLVEQALGRQVPLVLDPCLQFPPQVERSATTAARPYAVLYGHGFSDRFGSLVRDWADRRGVELVSLGYRNDFAHRQWLDADPTDFARAMAAAAAVVTNFFHGCVFALLNGKPFACAGSPYRMNKVRDLTRTLLAADHLLGDDADPVALAALLDRPLDPAIERAITTLRRQSDAYLPSLQA